MEAHLGKLQTCFEAAIPPVGPSASVIAEALLRGYEAEGWALTDVCPAAPRRRFPVLSDFVRHVEAVLRDRGYEGEGSRSASRENGSGRHLRPRIDLPCVLCRSCI